VQRRAVRGDEHVTRVLPPLPRRTLLGPLPAPVLTQQPHRVPVERDQPPAGRGLRRSYRDPVPVSDALLLDHRQFPLLTLT
jgi:hypothetical protein